MPSTMSPTTAPSSRSRTRTATSAPPSGRRRRLRSHPASRGGLRKPGTVSPRRLASVARARAAAAKRRRLACSTGPRLPRVCDIGARSGHAIRMTEPYDHERPPAPADAAPPPPVPSPEEPQPLDAAEAAEAAEVPTRRPRPLVGLLTTLGLGLAAVMTAQVLTAIAEGMALKSTEPQ